MEDRRKIGGTARDVEKSIGGVVLTPQPKQVQDIKKFLEVARRKDATRELPLPRASR
jgi:hypothetical protein